MGSIPIKNFILLHYTFITDFLEFDGIMNLVLAFNLQHLKCKYNTITIKSFYQFQFFHVN